MRSLISITLTAISAFFISNAAAQQLPNAGFESWVTTPAGEIPAGASGMRWTTNDSLVFSLGAYAPNKAVKKVTDAHSGTYALCLQEGYISIPSNGYVDSGGGVIFLGDFNVLTFQALGVAYTARPVSLSGFYKLTSTVAGADTARISATFKAGGSNIGQGVQLFYTAMGSYQPFTIPITWSSGGTPDKLEFFMDIGGVDKICNDTSTRFYVDDLVFNLPNGVKEHLSAEEGIQIYPNPASNIISIALPSGYARAGYFLTVYDAQGKLLDRFEAKPLQRISLQAYANGVYFIQLRDRSGAVIDGRRMTVRQ